jgi:hypothetical protein
MVFLTLEYLETRKRITGSPEALALDLKHEGIGIVS